MREGGVILYPTDTVWGIGCDATNEDAVRRVYEIKQRQDSKAMLVLVDSSVKVDFYVRDVPEVAWDLIDLADKPLTIIYSGARNLAANLLAVKTGKAKAIRFSTLEAICKVLDCQPGDILEYVEGEEK